MYRKCGLFFSQLRMRRDGIIIFVLGNHEIWAYDMAVSDLDEIIKRYRVICKKHDVIMLQNELAFFYDDRTGNGELLSFSHHHVISENELSELAIDEIQVYAEKAKMIVFGGLGFSGKCKTLTSEGSIYNADIGLYRDAVPTLAEDIIQAEKSEKAYLKVLEALSNYNVIIATHCPLDNWSERGYNSNFIYLSGHTHHNIFHMGSNYEKYKEQVKQILKELEIFNQKQDFCAYAIEMRGRQSFVVLFYHMENEQETYRYLEQTIVPMICNTARGRVICTWAVSDGFENMHEAVRELDHAAEWNLILKKGTLICKEKIQEIKLHSYKYPLHLEIEAKEALMNKDLKRFKEIFSRYQAYCRELPCTPQEAKEGCTHIALVLIQMAAEAGALQAQRKGQAFLQGISRANGWTDVEEKADEFFEYLTSKEECHNNISLLVQKALENIREYYDQGITLEEIAEKLHVTEEYLSTQFRKETGRTFTETIRGYRLEHVKKLLTVTNWKLTKIAEMVGYTDPKYMSRVFKEETGMLPLEYRKKNS